MPGSDSDVESSNSDAEWDFCEAEPAVVPVPAAVPAPARGKGYIPFQSNPVILGHIQKGVKPRYTADGEKVDDYPLILTIEIFPDLLGKPDNAKGQEQHERLSENELKNNDTTVSRIQRLIESCEVTIHKVAPKEEDLVMVDIQELEQGLRSVEGVKFHWGIQNPLHGYSTEADGEFRPYLYEKMVPRSSVEELRV